MDINMKKTKWYYLVIFLVVFFSLGAVAIGSSLVFKDDRQLTITWDKTGVDTSAAVCNVGSEELVSLQASLTGFGFKAGKKTVPDGEILDTPMSRPRLAAGDCWEIPVKSKGSSIPEAGSYSGLMVVYGAGAGLIQREVVIRVESSVPGKPADAKGSLVFFDDSDLNLTYRDLWEADGDGKAGIKVSVCNDGNGELGPVEAVLSDFELLKNAETVGEKILAVTPDKLDELKEGNCADFTISADGKTIPDSGNYEGFLSISMKNDDQTKTRIQRKVSLEIPSIESASAETVSIRGTRILPLPDAKVLLDPTSLQLKKELPGDPLLIPDKDTLLGYIENEGEYARVYAEKEPDETIKDKQLPIRIEGLSKIGTYTGKIYLAGMDVGAGETNLQVKVSDYVLWPILAILAGILLAFFIQLYLERWRISWELKKRTNAIQTNYENAKKDFPLMTFKFIFPGIEQIKTELAQFDKTLKDYGRDNLFYKTDSEDFKEIIKRVETIEADIKCIYNKEEQSSSLAKAVEDLKGVFKEKEIFILEFYPEREPAFVAKIKELIGEKEIEPPEKKFLEVGGSLEKLAEAKGYKEFTGNWVGMANKVDDYLGWSDKIQVVIPDEDWDGTDKEKLVRAAAIVVEVKYEMLQALNSADLEEFAAAKDLKQAYKELAYLSGKYQMPPWDQAIKLIEILDWNNVQIDQLNFLSQDPLWGTQDSLKRIVKSMQNDRLSRNIMERTPPPFLESKTRSGPLPKTLDPIHISRALWLGDAGVLLVSIAAAITLALQSSYVDKTFGTGFDYLYVVLVGSAIQTSFSGIKTLITNLRAPLKSSLL